MNLGGQFWVLLGIVYVVWAFGLRPLLVDRFHSRVFALRHSLFMLAADEKISFGSPAYRSAEFMLNALIQYAHKINLFRLFLLLSFMGFRLPGPLEAVKLQKTIATHSDQKVRIEIQRLVFSANIMAAELSIISFLPTAILYFLIVHVIGRIVHPLGRFIIMLAKQVVAKGKMGYIQEEAVLSFRNHRAA